MKFRIGRGLGAGVLVVVSWLFYQCVWANRQCPQPHITDYLFMAVLVILLCITWWIPGLVIVTLIAGFLLPPWPARSYQTIFVGLLVGALVYDWVSIPQHLPRLCLT